MRTCVRTHGDDVDDQPVEQRNVVVKVSKGAGGARKVEIDRARLQGGTHRDVVRMVLDELGDDPFVADVESMLGDNSVSLETVSSGSQSHYVRRDSPVDLNAVQDDELRYALNRDHTGGQA